MILQAPVGLTIVANILTGVASISLKVPGTFAGFPPTDATQARFFDHMDICADVQNDSDYIDDIAIQDIDGVVPAPARALFPEYPILINFSTDSGVATGAKAGYYFLNGCVKISKFSETPIVPSQLYFTATVHGGIGQTYHLNQVWGRATN